MKFVHEFDSSGWKNMHRLVAVKNDGTRIEGEFSLYEDFAFLSDARIKGFEEEGVPVSGWHIVTDYYDGTFPRLTRFETVVAQIEEADVEVFAKGFEKTVAAVKEAGDAIIAESAARLETENLCPCFQCKDKRAEGEDDGNEPGEQHFVLPA